MEKKNGSLEGSTKLSFLVDEEEQETRIDQYLAERCEHLSRSYLQKLMKAGAVLVNAQSVKASYKVAEGDNISCLVPEAVEPEILAEPMGLDILYEDKDVILINKSKGRSEERRVGKECYS